MAKRRITKSVLDRYDAENDTSIVRELEMEVDSCITSPGYGVQFWHDVYLYGVDEAILYIRNGNHGDWQTLAQKWEAIRQRIGL